MIREFEQYHGSVLSRLIHESTGGIIIESYPSNYNSSYVIDKKIGLYIKYSTKRMSPWNFTFKKEHQDEIAEMKSIFNGMYVVLVCGTDGVVCLSYEELKISLDEEHLGVEWIGVWRNPREKYTIKGTDGKLKYKIGENEFPSKLFK